MSRTLSSSRGAITPVMRDTAVPLSAGQLRLWLFHDLAQGWMSENVSLALRVRGRFDVAAAASAVRKIVARHEVLRTTFPCRPPGGHRTSFAEYLRGTAVRPGEPMQVIQPPAAVALPIQDVAIDDVHERVRIEAAQPFDLQRGPVWRGLVLRLNPADHVFLMTLHRIICDEPSREILARELEAGYVGRVLPPLPMQYADAAAHERGLNDTGLEGDAGYWKEQLAHIIRMERLSERGPADYRGPIRVERHAVEVPPSLSATLLELSRRESTRPAAVHATALAVLLSRYTGRMDVRIPVDVVQRPSGTESLIGAFDNRVVLRLDVSPRQRCRELLGRAELGLQRAEGAPQPLSEGVAQGLDTREQPDGPMSFVTLRSRPDLNVPSFGDADVEEIPTACGTPGALTWVCSDSGALTVEYSPRIANAAAVQAQAIRYRGILEQLTANPEAAVREIVLADPVEEAHLLASGRPDEAMPAAACDLGAWFGGVVRQRPDAIAAECAGAHVSYATLWAHAAAIAARLQHLGIGVEDRVAVWCDGGLPLLAAVLGIVRSGGVYVPIDARAPRERVRWLVTDCGAKAIVADRSLAADCVDFGVPIVDPSADPRAESPIAEGPPSPACAAYVIYTSGSTGEPKGVVITHSNVAGLIACTAKPFTLAATDVWTLFHSPAFDFSVWEMWGCWLTGGRLAVAPYAVSRAPDAFDALLRRAEVTVLNLTPSAFELWQSMAPSAGGPPLRVVIFGGEALDPKRLASWANRRRATPPALVNMYGITETTVHVTRRVLTARDIAGGGSPIGRALGNAAIYVRDAEGGLAASGVPGELYVGGAGVARGYQSRPALTAKRFVPDPWAGRGSRLYRSGDRARWRASDVDGTGTSPIRWELDYLGRLDEQAKVRGYRIEPGEIEAALRQHASVRQAVVLADTAGARSKRLIAYVTLEPSCPVGEETLREHLRALLPDYMVPAAIVIVARLPLTPNGKLDRRALPPPPLPPAGAQRQPGSASEHALAEIWTSVLRVDDVGADDDFFERGGDAMAAIRASARIGQVFGSPMPVRMLFEHATIASLACQLPSPVVERATEGEAAPRRAGPRPQHAAASARQGR